MYSILGVSKESKGKKGEFLVTAEQKVGVL